MADLPLSGQRIDLEHGGVAWWPCHIGKNAEIGPECSIGALAHIGQRVVLGRGCKIQGSAYIADECVLGDGVFIGPADLCADMGLLPNITHPDVRAAVQDGLRRIRAAGKAAGIIDADPALIQQDIDAGANFVALGADVILLADAMRGLVTTWKARTT